MDLLRLKLSVLSVVVQHMKTFKVCHYMIFYNGNLEKLFSHSSQKDFYYQGSLRSAKQLSLVPALHIPRASMQALFARRFRIFKALPFPSPKTSPNALSFQAQCKLHPLRDLSKTQMKHHLEVLFKLTTYCCWVSHASQYIFHFFCSCSWSKNPPYQTIIRYYSTSFHILVMFLLYLKLTLLLPLFKLQS